jgi:hypothetical protein
MLLVFDLLEKLGAGGSPTHVRLEMVPQRVRVDKQDIAGHQIGKGHACSGGGG